MTKTSFVIGRDPSCDVGFEDPTLSRLHCRVLLTPQGIVLEDLQSDNGVWIGEQRITRSLVADGESFRLGQLLCSVELPADARRAQTVIMEPGSTPVAWRPLPAQPAPPPQPAADAPAPTGWQMAPDLATGPTLAAESPVRGAAVPQPTPAPTPAAPAPAPPVAAPARKGSIDLSHERPPEPRQAKRRPGLAFLSLFAGLAGASALLYLTGWVEDTTRLWEGETAVEATPVPEPEPPRAPSLPEAQAFPGGAG